MNYRMSGDELEIEFEGVEYIAVRSSLIEVSLGIPLERISQESQESMAVVEGLLSRFLYWRAHEIWDDKRKDYFGMIRLSLTPEEMKIIHIAMQDTYRVLMGWEELDTRTGVKPEEMRQVMAELERINGELSEIHQFGGAL